MGRAELLIMAVTAGLAFANWLWARNQKATEAQSDS